MDGLRTENGYSRRKMLGNMTAFFGGLSLDPRDGFSMTGRLEDTRSDQREWIDENFLLSSRPAKILYHDYAKNLPIIDYHCHLPPSEIAANRRFKNLTELWLEGDHYKMRAMRANGIAEKYVTGNSTDFEKFIKWAETVPYTVMNPLYHWTHLELRRYFEIDKALEPSSAKEIYDKATSLLQTSDYQAQGLIKRMSVEVVCTTDDPVDDLLCHQLIKDQGYSVKVLPAWRPDKVMAPEVPEEYNRYLDKLAGVAGTSILTYEDLLTAVFKRQKFFHSQGCRLSDHGLATFYAADHTQTDKKIFSVKSDREGTLLRWSC